ncbi:AFR013Cp [Eremothecium gossypii ATCC 10895]|uniref:Lon protease homolog, mitochondrial n=1 Tax=Eremothecium gossypii (strain ATCC 10895 / CBS 109.51 / FGSC 9923 / NRRL Y-1056) TaxID=284811 RepID=LONM_EREGS|nr:AFR013Cp [Eremothecium gossypii ATCC 10895]Q754Q9.2 RecName: Full=Lon protease homolog, mitochondrial; Flags: Precursor [Eremothecium gossypii ATCC 10895]AAS53384.2 AFR013Cp [Eremothecium gossypii ATCC 10895]AEY97695.1 FAFR013Cp [Eremothecium gossypii FDAG1]
MLTRIRNAGVGGNAARRVRLLAGYTGARMAHAAALNSTTGAGGAARAAGAGRRAHSDVHVWALRQQSGIHRGGQCILKQDREPDQSDDKKVPPRAEEGRDEEAVRDEEAERQPREEQANRSSEASSSRGSGGSASSAGGGGRSNPPSEGEVPRKYEELMVLPMSNRPLFPGYYKSVTVYDPAVIEAICGLLRRNIPYLGAFLLKDRSMDKDSIDSIEEVHRVGVFAQITSVHHGVDVDGRKAMSMVLYPHRRVQLDELVSTPKLVAEAKEKATDDGLVQAKKEKFRDMSEGGEEEENPTEFLLETGVTVGNFSDHLDLPVDHSSVMLNALTSETLNTFKHLSSINATVKQQLIALSSITTSLKPNIFESPSLLADFAAAISVGDPNELQDVLETRDVEQRLEKALVFIKKEVYVAELQQKIEKETDAKVQKRYKDQVLTEQMRGIKKEMGVEDAKDKAIATFRERAEKLKFPEHVKKIFDEELARLSGLESAMSEYSVTKNYLDWITSLPWGIASTDQYSILSARKVLDNDHYGMQDVKDRILEFIAVGKLKGQIDGKIICLVGPPGVGKTSIGQSISRALNRTFFRFSVGGMSDVSEIKGHRRTYIGALPGRLIHALKRCQTENPLILIDEIDKLGRTGHQGDPASALLELLDPEQNKTFLDTYLDFPVDMSKVLFVCTANTLDTIPRPLLDRMEVIELSGYVADEKVKIAERHLIPAAKKSTGLGSANINLTSDSIVALLKNYCRESGVRSLKKHIEKIYRKAALKIVQQLSIDDTPKSAPAETNIEPENGKPDASAKPLTNNLPAPEPLNIPDSVKIDITPETLVEYLGPPVFTADRIYEKTPAGVVMGLAYTYLGGCTMYVESVLGQPLSKDSNPSLEHTGQLGDVMKESSRLAYSFSKMFMSRRFPNNRFFEKAAIHLHCPEGATPKDGPSAGITMASSLLSLAMNKPLDPTIAMTGELTLTGKVLRIGGIKEKTVAAKRSGAKTIIFPKDNMADWEDLPAHVKEGLIPVAAEWYDDVFNVLFGSVTEEEGNNVWKDQFDLIERSKATASSSN